MTEILLMEDTAALRRILTRMLRDAGYNVTAFDDGAASGDIDIIAGADILLTDLSMPGVDGKQALENIRRLRPELPVIVMTGTENVDDSVRQMACCYLRKPFSDEKLIRSIEKVLAKR